MLINCHEIIKSFDGKDILKGISFHMEEKEKAAIVGINGAGKTTLLKIIMGELEADSGSITMSKGATVGYLAQDQNIDSANTIFDELCTVKSSLIALEGSIRAAEEKMQHAEGEELAALVDRYSEESAIFKDQRGYAWRSEVLGVARGLGFSDEELGKRIEYLSGGQKTRVALGKLLLEENDLIILDEPTNHLDMAAVRWLENYLSTYRGAVLVVSHDRFFLDRIAEQIIEIDQGKSTCFRGNYTVYAEQKEKLRREKLKAYLNQQQEIQRQEAVIEKLKSFNREKSIRRAESREKMLAKIDVLEKPTEVRDDMRLELVPSCESGRDVLHVEGLAKAFGSERLFDDISFDIRRGERVALIGDNGTGKTTMLKLINGITPPDKGVIIHGVKVHVGYYDQEHHVLHDGKTLFQEMSDAYPDMNNTEIRNTLASFLFTGDDVFKLIGELSGGEKGRVSLAKLMLSEANFLLLDEPTNHLDITSREILEEALNSYKGTVLYVSHDRYFINRTATRILELKDGRLINYIGNYDYYLEHCGSQAGDPGQSGDQRGQGMAGNGIRDGFQGTDTAKTGDGTGRQSAGGADDWKAQKEAQARKRKKEAALDKCEQEIARLEERDGEINEELARPEVGTDLARLRSLSDEQTSIRERLDALYEEWEELSEQT